MKILKLHADNVMRLHVVDITPDASTVVVGGRNAQGKSSVLRSIELALGGKEASPRTPVRIGEEAANVVVDLGDIIVKRRIAADGKSTLSVESRDGAVFKSPQTMLDKLVGQLSFDPLAFSRMKPRDAADVLCKLVGLDLLTFHSRRQALYDERTAVNRQLKQAEHVLAETPKHDDAPESVVSVDDIASELKAARAAQKAADEGDRAAQQASIKVTMVENGIADAAGRMEALRAELLELEQRFANLKEQRNGFVTDAANARDAAEQLRAAVPDSEAITARLREVETINAKVRANAIHSEKSAEVAAIRSKSAVLTAGIEVVDAEKMDAVRAAAFPVPGLSVDDEGVMLNGVPFEQASSAEQLRASVAIGIAMNPKLRVLLVRDGSLLDDDGLRLLGELAAEHDAQVWVERVAANAEGCTVFIEDGSVRGVEQEASAAE